MLVRVRVYLTGLGKRPKTLFDEVMTWKNALEQFLYPEHSEYYENQLRASGFVGECIGQNKVVTIKKVM